MADNLLKDKFATGEVAIGPFVNLSSGAQIGRAHV